MIDIPTLDEACDATSSIKEDAATYVMVHAEMTICEDVITPSTYTNLPNKFLFTETIEMLLPLWIFFAQERNERPLECERAFVDFTTTLDAMTLS